MKYLFDTNVWIAIQRGNQKVGDRWRQRDADSVFLCTPALAELYQGVLKSAKKEQNVKFVEQILFQHDCLVFGVAESKRYAELVNAMYANNQTGKVMDLQIAAVASVHGLRVVTHDVEDFGRVPGIEIEDWES
jgi:tRNA(fMet)-specific endonuclease VapC